MKKTAVGFRVHSGWTALVAVSLEKGAPAVLSRQRVQLVETFSYKFRQPYHTGEKLTLEKAREFIQGVRTEAETLAYRSLHAVQVDLEKQAFHLDRGGLLLASGRTLPDLEKILQSHALIHTADGELFRETLRRASARCGLQVMGIKERELLDECAEAFSLKPPELLRRATELGRPFGSPWTQDEKFATLAAWLALAAPARPDRKASRNPPAA
jgi:hypothetical protein